MTPDRSRGLVGAPRIPYSPRRIFAASVLGAVSGFAMTGMISSVAPGFLTKILGVTNSAAIGLSLCLVFIASALAQILLRPLADRVLQLGGAAALVVSMVLLIIALLADSFPVLIVSMVISGAGQGVMFMVGMRAILAHTDAAERTHATTSYFIIAYLSIAIPPIAAGLLSSALSLTATAVVFALAVAVTACCVPILAKRFSAVPGHSA